ncbi:MAG TPA: NUDIX domain-containing protein [Solirubrobacteraceae bacterium]|jgi:ADP-ribose pyrophosphatase YjhB (NUDIX family)|nr:NUDIX domain-containing protein [Solirubrobacteraceae bacterium]
MPSPAPLPPPELLARGPWALEAVHAHWQEHEFEPPRADSEAADAAIADLRGRGSPSHDGRAARLVSHEVRDGRLLLEMQPLRWALRLLKDTHGSMASLCVTRDAQGRWLAGRRAAWLSTWAGRWALGAGGSVDLHENPARTLVRELDEEWSVAPERVQVEALMRLPHDLVMLVGQAWLPDGAEVVPDHEHDEYAWWAADVDDWPAEADDALRRMARFLSA